MSNHRGFLSLALAGEAGSDEIDDYIDRWHQDLLGLSLHVYLGMTREEYGLWLDWPDSLPLIIASRKLNKPLNAVASAKLQAMRLTASRRRSEIKQLQAWLQRTYSQKTLAENPPLLSRGENQ